MKGEEHVKLKIAFHCAKSNKVLKVEFCKVKKSDMPITHAVCLSIAKFWQNQYIVIQLNEKVYSFEQIYWLY